MCGPPRPRRGQGWCSPPAVKMSRRLRSPGPREGPAGISLPLTGGGRRSPRCPRGCVRAPGGSRVLFPPAPFSGAPGMPRPLPALGARRVPFAPHRAEAALGPPNAAAAHRPRGCPGLPWDRAGLHVLSLAPEPRPLPPGRGVGLRSPGEMGTAPPGAAAIPARGSPAAARGGDPAPGGFRGSKRGSFDVAPAAPRFGCCGAGTDLLLV